MAGEFVAEDREYLPALLLRRSCVHFRIASDFNYRWCDIHKIEFNSERCCDAFEPEAPARPHRSPRV
jgi:hypothetical protein